MPANLDDLVDQAIAAHAAGRAADAERLYRDALELEPAHPDANHNLGVLLALAGKFEPATGYFRRALEANPRHPQYWLSLVRALATTGEVAAARAALAEARQRGAQSSALSQFEHRLAADKTAEQRQPTQRPPPQAWVRLLDAGRFREVALAAREQVRGRPNDAFAWNILGIASQASGDPIEAEKCFRTAMARQSNFADAHCNLGRLLMDQGRIGDAEKMLRQALKIHPKFPEALNNLALVLIDLGRAEEAQAPLEAALRLRPDDPRGQANLGMLLVILGHPAEAIDVLGRALGLNPNSAEAHFNLGNAHLAMDHRELAATEYRAALALRPDYVEARFGLGNALLATGLPAQAVAAYRGAVEFKPDFVAAWLGIGNACLDTMQPDDALPAFRCALRLAPDSGEAKLGMARSLSDVRCSPLASIDHLLEAIESNPMSALAHSLLGSAYACAGRHDLAAASIRQALSIRHDFEDIFGSLLFTGNYHPEKSEEEIYEVYREYDERFGKPHKERWQEHRNPRDEGRRLKVGYVSPDFNKHAVTNFLEPLLANHDKGMVEVYAYAELKREDEATARYRTYVDHWIATRGMTDEALAERIRTDEIDVLVDVAGHTAGNRLEVFARKPAPVSVSWLGFGYTTGLTAIDYFLTDEASVPEGTEGLYSEKPWRLKGPGYVYRPTVGMGEVSDLPALARGYVTLGTLTRAVRINHRVIRVWSEIMKRLPGAKLVVDSGNYRDEAMQNALAAQFAEQGIERDRLEIGYHSPPWDTLRSMDIGLDCFPHNSGTTLFESLYMGIPYVTLAGRTSPRRLGSSILAGAGHPEWIAETEAAYIEKVVGLASDLEKLSGIRKRLREEMATGLLRDEAGFARKVEAAYRDMWQIVTRNPG